MPSFPPLYRSPDSAAAGTAAGVTWDLSELYAGPADPALAADHEQLLAAAREFEGRYHGRLEAGDCTAAVVRAALDEYEALLRRRARPGTFASLLFSADTTDPARGALLQRTRSEGTAVAVHLLFVPLELGRMPAATYEALRDDPLVAPYRHFLEHLRATARHHLSEPEERIVEELSNTGARAFTRLFAEITSRAVFRVRHAGEERALTQAEALTLLYDPDREVRRAAGAAITETLRQQAHPLTFIFNTVLQHKATMDRLRGFEYPEQSRHLDNELDPEVVQTMVTAVTAGQDVVAEYYRLKRGLLGLEELDHCDRYAPIEGAAPVVGFAEARELVLDAFAAFSPRVRELIEPFFTRRWIDAEVRPGKRGGAFCSYGAPDHHPYVFMNYAGRPRDVMTLAHELGHGLHGQLARHQHMLDFHPTLPLAETASVFAEMLTFERLQAQLADPRARLALLCSRIEDSFATVFRQITLYRFEQAAHRARRSEGELPTERYNALWQEESQTLFGDAVRLGDDHAWWWLYIPHFINTPFYVYAYAFGELLVLALYSRYRREGPAFVDAYLELLAAGGSRTPEELLGRLGIDPRRPEFWQGGVELIRELVAQARELAAA